MKLVRNFTFITLTFPVFSITRLLGLPNLNNVILSILIVGSLSAVYRKVKLDESFIYSWLIGLGLLLSLLYQMTSSINFDYANFVFPLTWLFFPFFMTYWSSIGINKRKNFCELFFCLNFIYSYIQIIIARLLGYSLMIHRFPSDYVITSFSQDTPFSYLGLTGIHNFISNNIGAASTGLLTERVNLMTICVLFLLRRKIFNHEYEESQILKKTDKHKIIETFNLLSAITLLSICGSSLSLAILILPFVMFSIYLSKVFEHKIIIKVPKLSSPLRGFRNVFIGFCCALAVFIFLLPFLINTILQFDASGRIAAIVGLEAAFSRFAENLDLVFFGAGVVPTFSRYDSSFLEGNSLLPRSLDIVGYTFNSFGLFGLVPFIVCYPILLGNKTLLRKEAVAFFCLLTFVAAGSPMNYVYVYALLLSLPRQHSRKSSILAK
jgi:hypothetical protein